MHRLCLESKFDVMDLDEVEVLLLAHKLRLSKFKQTVVDMASLNLTHTVPPVSTPMQSTLNKVCQFMSHPLEAHWLAVKRILRYLKGAAIYFGPNLISWWSKSLLLLGPAQKLNIGA
ncbi:hypothetical protein L195_g054448 [Trifolium pratense]|uniref:Retrovirus-related Pol polyprotein from transposon TNT 1-94 n=1 Tax=Trifolium pratense TaxID=57577 RepID=A0A2K3KG74_TRIPR|nr:hypothetical protein L195_g054448 [Trifolium pratense]